MVAFTVGDEGFTSLAGYPGSEEAEGDAEELLVGQVSQIKLHLQDAIDKGDEATADEIISDLEKMLLTKRLLEITRIGLSVNEARKTSARNWPTFSKRCRLLIKSWQQLTEYGPGSSASVSTDGTPTLSPYSFGLTPPALNGRLNKKSTLTRKNTSVSPLTNKRCHKSISAESKLYLLDDCGRPVDSKEIGLLHIPCIRPFEVAHNYENSPSLHEARKNVQSTAGLLAQLSDDIVPNSENGCTESQFLKFTSQNQTSPDVNTEEYDSNIRHEDGSGGEKNVQANETPDESVSLSLPNSEIFYKDRYNWFTEYPIKPREQSTSINSISRRGLTQMPFCDIGLHK